MDRFRAPAPAPHESDPPGRARDADPGELPPPQALKEAYSRLGELREYITYYLAARADAVKLSLRRAGMFAVLGAIGALAGGAIVVTAAVLVCIGLAQGLGRALNGHIWAGNLIVGLGILVLLGIGAWVGMILLTRSARKKTVKKYEQRRVQQRSRFGHDVRQRAGELG